MGTKIRAYRLKKGISLTTLSELTGIAASNLSSIELNKTSPTLATLVKIATAFDVRVGAFLDEVLYRKAVYCGKGEAERRDRGEAVTGHLLTEGVALNGMDACLMVFREPCPPMPVLPQGTDRFLYCLLGHIKIWMEDETYDLRSGDSLYLLPEAQAMFLMEVRDDTSILVVNTRT